MSTVLTLDNYEFCSNYTKIIRIHSEDCEQSPCSTVNRYQINIKKTHFGFRKAQK